jgi:hypothetical protein
MLSAIPVGSVPMPLLVSWSLMVLVLGAVGYGRSRRFPPGAIQPATVPAASGTSTRADTWRIAPIRVDQPAGFRRMVHQARSSLLPPTGDLEYAIDRPWSPAARLGIWFQPPRRVPTGRQAHIRWWHRVRSVVLLALFVVMGGVATATAIGITVFLSGFLVEQAIG